MDTFDERVEQLEQQNAAPITELKQRYAVTRATLVQEWKTFLKHKPTLEAIFQEAQVKHQKAIAVGVYYPDLARNLAEVYGREGVTGTLQAMQGNYDYALGKIDGLDEKDLNFPNILAGLYNEPARLHDNLNQLEKVAKKVEEQLKELYSRVQKRLSSPPATPAVPVMVSAERQAGPIVEKGFEV